MKVHYFEDLKGYVASFETPQDIVIYTLKEHNSVVCQVAQGKDKISSKDHALNRLIVTINKLRDKVSRRNMQTKALKEKIKALNKYVCKTCSKPMTNVTCMNCPYWSINA